MPPECHWCGAADCELIEGAVGAGVQGDPLRRALVCADRLACLTTLVRAAA